MADPRGPQEHRSTSTGMPTWGWAAIVIAVVVVIGLFMWSGDGVQQQTGSDTVPPATTGSTPPAKSPDTAPPPANTPPANTPPATPPKQ